MSDRTLQLAGLFGFVLSGLCFLVVGVQARDIWTILGCATWMFACGLWAVPVWRQENR